MRAKTIEQAMFDNNGYVNVIKCKKCATDIGFNDKDVKFVSNRRLLNGDVELKGYVECPECGQQVLVKIDVTGILSKETLAKYYTTYRRKLD